MNLVDSLVELLAGVPPPLATIILAMVPIGELRGALPVALLVYQLPIVAAVVLSILGNILPVYFLLVFFEHVAAFLERRGGWGKQFLDWLYERTRRKLADQVERYGPWALALFVAIPLPVTGAWTGTLAAFVFGLSKPKAFMAILLGLVGSAFIVTILTLLISTSSRVLFGS